MIVNFGAFAGCPTSGSWEAWCDCIFANADSNAKCKSKPLSVLTPPPWTVVGRQVRGLPAEGESIVGSALSIVGGTPTVTPAAPPTTDIVPEDEGIFGLPKTVALVGGLVLVGGLASFVLLRRRRVRR